MSTPTSTITTRRDSQLAVHHLGGKGDVLLICHATGFHSHCYVPMVATLSQRFSVWGIDMAGHGASGPPPDLDFSWDQMGRDLLDAIDAMGWSKPHLFGHSMGGAVCLSAALDRPDLATAMYVYEPIVIPVEWQKSRGQHFLAEAARRRREVFESRDQALGRFSSRPPLNLCRSDALHNYVERGFTDLADGTVQLSCRGEFEALTYEADATEIDARTAEIVLPTTIAYGGSPQPPNPAALAPTLAHRMPNGKLKNFANLGHLGPFEAPSLVATHVLRAFAAKSAAKPTVAR